MSLISDALRKARREASEREARAQGVAPPPMPAGREPRAGLGTGIVVGAVVAAVAALVGGAAVWWVLGGGGSPPAAVAEAAMPTPAATSSTPPVVVETAPTAVPAPPAASLPQAEPGSASETAVATPAPRPATPTPPPTPTPDDILPPLIVDDEPAATDEPPVQGRPTPSSEVGTSREFGLVADLGYARLELGYLISRPDDPFAEINGVEVHVGSRIEGFRVDEIGKTFVRLSDDRGPVLLRVR